MVLLQTANQPASVNSLSCCQMTSSLTAHEAEDPDNHSFLYLYNSPTSHTFERIGATRYAANGFGKSRRLCHSVPSKEISLWKDEREPHPPPSYSSYA